MSNSSYLFAALFCVTAFAQTAPPAAPQPAAPQAPAPAAPQVPATPGKPAVEMATKDEPAIFKTRVNLVVVPVVVRDRHGKAVGNLKQEDFQLLDRGKPQYIARFSMEKAAGHVIKTTTQPVPVAGGLQEATAPADLPDRFVAYLFDDIHTQFGDMVRSRDAATRHIDKMAATDRAAIFTTSGQVSQDFTDDRDLLHAALAKLHPRPISGQGQNRCPNMSYYMADLIQNKNDPNALQAAALDTMACMNLDPTDIATAQRMAQAAASTELSLGDHETRVAMSVIKDIVRRMAAMPGQRSIILVSAGFLTLDQHSMDKTDIMDRAIRANVLINSLDARGLYTYTSDITRPGTNSFTSRVLEQMDRETARAQEDVMAELAAGTGASFFQNNNDLDEGFARLAAAPEFYYLLAFSPQNLKMDGTFHSLKVSLKAVKDISVNSRKGYYAPRHLENAIETAKREIEEALFSREEMSDIPVELHSQFFKSGEQTARVTLLIKIDVKRLKFRKEEDRNRDDLTVVAGLFDRNGVYVIGQQKKLEMRLKDETLEKRVEGGITIRTTLDVKPGAYSVRLVVRDSEGQLMSAQNGAVDIPY